ncbi:RNA helicase PWA37_004928 [Arxiozyma heterogenica]|uniref:RNA helicase n=1 Tax=Arxiozyma heterogenica TaxID=278026 RepID=UPI002EFBFB6B
MDDSQFECKTCHEKGSADQLMKHLSTTRHKTVIDISDPQNPEELCCEECKDNNNVHQLEIIRFGGDDMDIYCKSCLSKLLNNEDKIDQDMKQTMVSYSLNNGALLSFWIKFKIFRDCYCLKCGDDELKMNVKKMNQIKNSSKSKNNTLNTHPSVFCDNCVNKLPKNERDYFISEDSHKFIYHLLNIPEPSNKLKKLNRKRKSLRGGKRRSKNKRNTKSKISSKKVPKPMTLMQKMTKEAFSNKRENSKIISASDVKLSSFKGFKAINSESNLQSLTIKIESISLSNGTNTNSNKDNDNKNKTLSFVFKKPEGNNMTNGVDKIQSTPNLSRLEKESSKKDVSTISLKNDSITTKQNDRKKQKNKTSEKNTIKKQFQTASNSKQTKLNKSSNKKNKNMQKVALKSNNNKLRSVKEKAKTNFPNDNNTIQSNRGNSIMSRKESKSQVASTSWSNGWSNNLIGTVVELNNNTSESGEEGNLRNKKNNEQTFQSKTWSTGWDDSFKGAEVSSHLEVKEAFTKKVMKKEDKKKKKEDENNNYHAVENKSTESQYSGNSIEEGTHLRAYEKFKPVLAYPDMKTYCDTFSYALFQEERLESSFMKDIKIMWPLDKKESVFVFKTSTNNPELQYVLAPHLLKAGRIPFNQMQPLMLVNKYDDTQVWYCFIKEVAKVRKEYHVLVELFPWNKLVLPTTLGSDDLMILPTSVQTNRILFSMTRLTNPKFIQLLLGNEKIKQIKFNNRLKFSRDTLNESQKDAVETVLNNSVTVIQGPPGTGKTSTIEEIIVQLIENLHTYPILCVAASNIAIDNIAEKLMESKPDIKILRILSDRKESEYAMDHPLGSVCLHNLIMRDLPDDVRNNYLAKQRGEILSANADRKLYENVTKYITAHVCRAQVILTTNMTAGGRQLKVIKELPVVIMDESTQSSEVSTLVPLSLPGIKKFVFVGDDKQLSSFSNVLQLEMSLFERILKNGSYEEPKMLNTQYRMHPQVSEFPIAHIYDNKLQNGVTKTDKSWDGIKYPLYFISCRKGSETKVTNDSMNRGDNVVSNSFRLQGYTYINTYECDIIISVIYKLLDEKHVSLEDIGVVTPYSAQRDYISSRLVEDMVINPKGLAMVQEIEEDKFSEKKDNGLLSTINGIQSHTVNIINGLQVATVDSYQGHEKNFIIFSCVRSNKENKIGFLMDKRRLNVALTRSKYGLILVGNDSVLERGGGMWRTYIRYLRGRKLIFPSLDQY